MSQHRLIVNNFTTLLDTTAKSGDKTFAPTWDMVMGSKNGIITHDQYRERYWDMMKDSVLNNEARWREVMDMDSVALACYCPSGKFCHRHELRDIFIMLGGIWNKPVEFMFEITKENLGRWKMNDDGDSDEVPF